MNFLIDPLKKMDSYKRLLQSIEEKKDPIRTHGILTENTGHIIYGLKNHVKKQNLVLTYDEKRARNLYDDIVNLGGEQVYLFPEKEYILYDVDAHSNEDNNRRLEVISKLNRDEDIIVVASVHAILDKIISKEVFQNMTKKISIGDEVDLEEIKQLLILSGYERVPMVEGIGQFSLRGGILDFFPSDIKNPIRIEFFDIEVDSIRSFDIIDQRSIETLDKAYIMPIKEILILDQYREGIIKKIEDDLSDIEEKNISEEEKEVMKDKFTNLKNNVSENIYIGNREILIPYIPEKFLSSIISYFKEDGLVYVDEPKRIEENIEGFFRNYEIKFENLFENGELLERHLHIFHEYENIKQDIFKRIYIENSALLTNSSKLKPKSLIRFTSKGTQSYHKKMEILKSELNYYREENYKIVIMSGTEDRGKRLKQLLMEEDINAEIKSSYDSKLEDSQIVIIKGSLQGGFEYPEEKFVLINDKDIFGAGKRKKRRKKRDGKKILSFTDLKTGDYIVHENHGIGRYDGVEQLDIQGVKKDYLNIKYRDGDRLYVPIDQMNLIQKYIGSDSINPKVNKLSSAEWAKTKQKAMKAVEDMAEELLELYAKREDGEGFKFSQDSTWQRQFEDLFPHEETEGQLESIEEIKTDMQSNKPMDRLLCGDVGYGKTEVALRAAFKAVLDGKQVAFLVPTTILAQQHYNTIRERFSKFPVEIAVLSRFRTAAEQKKDLAKIRAGVVDIVVGTHRILSKDLRFKDLGLLIVDEEQRFGVKHKEALKQFKESIDVLTLTATPIPRTLHMSLSGIRDMSVLEEPPEERYPVQTYVVEFNEQMIRDAILREISRGGQVYFVYNRVQTIDKMASMLKELVPEASFATAHGQMNERVLENVMMDFVDKAYDVLVCTTIIETGLDVPNVNTIIINDSDKMGLSQLYQLRGRVGRSDRVSYGYFTYAKDKVLTEIAESRLLAIKEFTEFGSGFKIAMRDLEIRGAGNLLGAQQHGQIEAIGYDLYVKFLNATIKKIRGEEVESIVDTIIDLEVDGYINDKYIQVEEQKVEIYKKIGSLENIEEYRELVDELIDRFGDLPIETENLMDVSYIRALGSRNNIKSIIQSGKDVNFEFDSAEKLKPEFINQLSIEYSHRITFNMSKIPGFKYRVRRDVLLEMKELLEKIESFNNPKKD